MSRSKNKKGDGELQPQMGEEVDFFALAQRVQADFENYKKRARVEIDKAHESGRDEVLVRLFPVLDDLDLAVASMTSMDVPLEALDGIKLIHEKFLAFLKYQGIKILDPVGEEFDPHRHEAVGVRKDNNESTGKILEVVRKGYIYEEYLLRPAKVVIAR